jgi:A/G-specific adenine glycosylase
MFSERDLKEFRKALLAWYEKNRRDLPWRRTKDPYAILVSEVLLQQTRVKQALAYYERFLRAFPDFSSLAKASEEEVLRVWAGAGYYRRARNLHRLAQAVAEKGIPKTYAELLRLPGMGPYTAAAVASVAFGEAVAVVDGNVRRVLARLFAQKEPKTRWLRDTAGMLLEPADPGTWNQALMELGSLLCTPKSPKCSLCPVAAFCAGKGDPERYPAPQRRAQKPAEAAALVLYGKDGVFLERRDGGLLGGLWGVPLAEGPAALERLLSRFGLAHATYVGQVRHAFTHKRLSVEVYAAFWEGKGEDPKSRPLSVLDHKILRLFAEWRTQEESGV